jgi:predicted dehydrogenase
VEIGQDGTWRRVPGDGANGFAEQHRRFATYIAGGQQPQTGGRYARHVMDILFAADESSISGREVLLTDIGRRP